MSELKVFSIGQEDSIAYNHDIIVGSNVWEAVNFYRTTHPDHYGGLAITEHRSYEDVLFTDENDKTTTEARADIVLGWVKSSHATPVCAGYQKALTLFEVDGEYGVVAPDESYVITKLLDLVDPERFMDLIWRYKTMEEFEPGTGAHCDVDEPFVPFSMTNILTIDGVTATIEEHVRHAAHTYLEHGHLLYVKGKDGILRSPAHAKES